MGLPMQDIHSRSFEKSAGASSVAGEPRSDDEQSLHALISEKDAVESELRALGAVLDSHGVNMNTSLTSFDGFPRADIDVAQIRTTRARIIHLRNDYKSLMNRIEQGLHAHHASSASGNLHQSSPTTNTTTTATTTPPAPPSSSSTLAFARVSSVAPYSPAEAAGLLAGDLIQKFGDANWRNHEKLSKVSQIVSQNEGRSIPVTVQRSDPSSRTPFAVELTLVPRLGWGGRGMLGCHLLPV